VTLAASDCGRSLRMRQRPQRAVIDTNVWLDLHYFLDREALPLAGALDSADWVAARCEQTDAELAAVLARPPFCAHAAARLRLSESLRQWQAKAAPAVLNVSAPCRCRDPHDQKFLDLAFSAQADALVTRDKALLALARCAQTLGLAILTPREFASRFLPPAARPDR
jgi:putative PIN family toxin of toxin-antitoxin system